MTVCNMSIEAGARAGHDRAGRDHVRLPRGPPARARGRGLGRGRRRTGGRCAPTTTRSSTRRSCIDAAELDAVRHLGHQPRPGRCRCRRPCPTRRRSTTPSSARAAERALEYMGLTAGHAAARHRGRHRVRRLVHQRPHRGPARRRRRAARAARSPTASAMLVVPGSMQVKAAGRGGGPGRGLHRGRRRVARGGLLDVPGHEPRPAHAGRAQRLHLQPQLRGPAGQGRPHPPGVARRSPPPPPSPAG